MRRCWFGAAALVVLLILGLLSSRWMGRQNDHVAQQMAQAARAAESGDWDRAGELTRQAERHWREGRGLSAVLSDHAPMEQVDAFFALLNGALARRDTAGYGDLCAQITLALQALGEAQRFSWENLL